MDEELTYETIPGEFWPKCAWCGEDVGDGVTFKKQILTRSSGRTICLAYFTMILDIINGNLASMLRDVWDGVSSDKIDLSSKDYTLIDGLEIAIQNMKKAKES